MAWLTYISRKQKVLTSRSIQQYSPGGANSTSDLAMVLTSRLRDGSTPVDGDEVDTVADAVKTASSSAIKDCLVVVCSRLTRLQMQAYCTAVSHGYFHL